jgi:cytochrome c556
MDDQFLHQLRREPPADFAVRLKWQLDRPVPPRRLNARLILALALCGTALSLGIPPGRRALIDWFATLTNRTHTAAVVSAVPEVPSAPAAARLPRTTVGPLVTGLAPRPSVVPPTRAVQPASDAAAAPPRSDADNATAVGRPRFAPTAIVGSPTQTPERQAAAIVGLRQGLFRTLDFVTQPLGLMQRGAGVDMRVLRSSATRVKTLSSLIPEVFSQDTRPFHVTTRAADSIWTNPEGFASKADDLSLASDALTEAAATGDEPAALRAIGRIETACSACHDVFRTK